MTREEAYKTLKENLCTMCVYGSQNMDSCDIRSCDNRDAIKALEQEPKTGYWIVQPSNKEQGERPFIWWKCSNCGQVIFSETTHDRLEFHAFCGRCGFKMIEPQESEMQDGCRKFTS